MKEMSASRGPPKFALSNPVIEGPITSFPEDVGWMEASRLPIKVHARKMGTAFTVVRDGETTEGKPGDYLVAMDDGKTLAVVEGDVFSSRYSIGGIPVSAPSSAPPEDDRPWSEERKQLAKDSSSKLLGNLSDMVRRLGDDVREFQSALDSEPTAPPLFACPFCDVSGKERPEVRNHILQDHLMKALFGGMSGETH